MSHPYREQVTAAVPPYPTSDDLMTNSSFRYPDPHQSPNPNGDTIQMVPDANSPVGQGFDTPPIPHPSVEQNGYLNDELPDANNPIPSSPKFSSTELYNTSANSIDPIPNSSPKFSSFVPSNLFPTVAAQNEDQKPTSPNSSVGSSITNLNQTMAASNQNNLLPIDPKFSNSETSLLNPNRSHSHTSSYGHSRSISSTSSFFYDRSSDNASMIDFSQNLIQQYLGTNATQLLPRIKTIELYRKNAKKSNDPAVIFQYAQYILQTALLLDVDSVSSSNSNSSSTKNSPKAVNNRKSQRDPDTVDEAKLKRQLIKESIFYLKKLSDKGYAEAQYLLGDAYSSGAVGKTENKEAFLLFVHAAKHGHVESAYRTSHCYEEGLGTGRDARKSVEYLKIAAAKNHAAAMYKLGVYSFYGRMGLPSNTDTQKMGIKWLTRASNIATELIAAAPYELGKIYFNGFKDIVIPDKKYALELYSQAAALGHIQSAAILGQMYETGDIVPQDGNLSIHYYTQAALGGDPESMLAMCAWYLVGCDPHLPKDDNEAFEWAKRAAQCNLARAQFALANFYEKGIGCIKNVTEAQTWYLRAAENGDAKALERITDSKLVAKLKKKNSFVTSDKGMADAKEKDCVIM